MIFTFKLKSLFLRNIIKTKSPIIVFDYKINSKIVNYLFLFKKKVIRILGLFANLIDNIEQNN